MSLVDPETKNVYIIGKIIGKGTSSIVHLVTKESSGEIFTVKIINISSEKFNVNFVQNEINIHIKLKHPNILNMQLSFFGSQNINFYIITDYCVNDSLRTLIKNRKKLSYPEIRYCILQIINGLKYLHGNNIMHRDIKLDNILLDSEMNLKIADFGFATTDLFSQKQLGTPNYIAPEIVKKQKYDYKVDIWALGVLIYIISFGVAPFFSPTATNLKDIMRNILDYNYKFPEDADDDLKNLIQRIFQPASRRLSLDQIEKHSFMNGVISTTLNYT